MFANLGIKETLALDYRPPRVDGARYLRCCELQGRSGLQG
jgi:hypothetical protein